MTDDPLGTFREDLVAASSHARSSRRRRYATIGGAALVVAVAAIAVGVRASDPSRQREEVVSGGPPTSEDESIGTAIPTGPVWSIAAPPGWRRAGPELLPGLGPTSLTLATIPLSDAAGGACGSVPEEALRRLGSDDALVTLVFYGPKAVHAPPWPDSGFDESSFPADPARPVEDCDLPGGVEVHAGEWSQGGQGVGVLAAFGTEVTAERQAEAWAAVSSLQPEHGDAAGRPACVVTRPTEPGLTVPDEWPERPSSGVWYGTEALWTALPTDGSSPTPRKSVWWSTRFQGGSREPTPEINVTWERLDAPAPTVQALSQGTNAHSVEDGSFMIAGIDPLTAGCWSVTASYRGANLSYVYWSAPGLWTAVAPTTDATPELVEGIVHFDEERSCVVLRGDDGRLTPVVWPAATSLTTGGRISLTDGTTLDVGDRVRAAGSVEPAEPHLATVTQGCMPDSIESEVVVLSDVVLVP